jgi:hypothetical protein
MKSEGSVPTIPTKGATVLTDAQKAELDPAVLEIVEKAEKDAKDATEALETANASVATEKAAREAAETELEKAKKPVNSADVDADDPIKKDELPPAVRAALEKAEARETAANERVEKAEKAAEDAGKLAKAEHDARIEREWIAKAESGDLRGLPGAPADIGPVMKRLSEAAPEDWATLEKSVLVPAVAQIRQGELFKEQGKGGEGPPPESALAKMREKVTELRKSDASLTQAQAMEQVRKSDPTLQNAVAEELGSAGAR